MWGCFFCKCAIIKELTWCAEVNGKAYQKKDMGKILSRNFYQKPHPWMGFSVL